LYAGSLLALSGVVAIYFTDVRRTARIEASLAAEAVS
jgi:hypothetical protein